MALEELGPRPLVKQPWGGGNWVSQLDAGEEPRLWRVVGGSSKNPCSS